MKSLIIKKKTIDKAVKRELSYTVGGNINWCRYHGKQDASSSKNEIELLYHLASTFMGIYMKNTKTLI